MNIVQTYIIGNDDFTELACEDCAIQYAKENNLEWNTSSRNYTEEHESGAYASCDVFGQVETDTPQACDCGSWLRVSLTDEGVNYILENFYTLPSEVVEYYLGDTVKVYIPTNVETHEAVEGMFFFKDEAINVCEDDYSLYVQSLEVPVKDLLSL